MWKLSLLLFNGGKKIANFQLFLPPDKMDWSKILFSCQPEHVYDIWPKLLKISSKSEKLLLNKIIWRFRQVTFFKTSLIKSWSDQFMSLIDFVGIKKNIIGSAKMFGLEGQKGWKSAAGTCHCELACGHRPKFFCFNLTWYDIYRVGWLLKSLAGKFLLRFGTFWTLKRLFFTTKFKIIDKK